MFNNQYTVLCLYNNAFHITRVCVPVHGYYSRLTLFPVFCLVCVLPIALPYPTPSPLKINVTPTAVSHEQSGYMPSEQVTRYPTIEVTSDENTTTDAMASDSFVSTSERLQTEDLHTESNRSVTPQISRLNSRLIEVEDHECEAISQLIVPTISAWDIAETNFQRYVSIFALQQKSSLILYSPPPRVC